MSHRSCTILLKFDLNFLLELRKCIKAVTFSLTDDELIEIITTPWKCGLATCVAGQERSPALCQTAPSRISAVCRVLRAEPNKTAADWQPEAVRVSAWWFMLSFCVASLNVVLIVVNRSIINNNDVVHT